MKTHSNFKWLITTLLLTLLAGNGINAQSFSLIEDSGNAIYKKSRFAILPISNKFAFNSTYMTKGITTFNFFNQSEASVMNEYKSISLTEAKQYVLVNAPKVTTNINIKFTDDEKSDVSDSNTNESFFTEELLYFIGASALAATFYLVWSDNDVAVNKKTFGQPPKP